jgi:hypothetical protein
MANDPVYYVHEIINFFRDGLHEGFAHVNAVLGIIISMVAAYMLSSWKKIWTMALGATIVHLIAEVMIPVIANENRFELPPNILELSYWRAAVSLYLGYLVVIAIFYFIKTKVLPSGAHGHAH